MRGGLLTSQGFCIAFYDHYFRRKDFLTIIPPEQSYHISISFKQCLRYTFSSRKDGIIFKQSPLPTPTNCLLSPFVAKVGGSIVVGNHPWCWLYYRWSFPVSPSVSHAEESVYLPRHMHSIVQSLFYAEILCSSYLAINAHLHCMPANQYALVTLLHMEILPPLASAYLLAPSNDYHKVQDLNTSLGSYSILLRHLCSGLRHLSRGENHRQSCHR